MQAIEHMDVAEQLLPHCLPMPHLIALGMDVAAPLCGHDITACAIVGTCCLRTLDTDLVCYPSG